METKYCPECQDDLPIDQFPVSRRHRDGYNPKCEKHYSNWYLANRERVLELRRANYIHHSKADFTQAHDGVKGCSRCKVEWPAVRDYFQQSKRSADGLSGICKPCKRKEWKSKREKHIKYQREHRDYDAVREWRHRIRQEMLDAYGRKCACCNESHEEFLQLDHIGGRNDKNHPWHANYKGSTIYGKLKKLGWPSEFRLLCANCNWAIRYNDVCPHKRE